MYPAWKFIKAHLGVIVGMDFFTVEVATGCRQCTPCCPESRRQDSSTKSRQCGAWKGRLERAGYRPMLPSCVRRHSAFSCTQHRHPATGARAGGAGCGRVAQLSAATSERACWGRPPRVTSTSPSSPSASPRIRPADPAVAGSWGVEHGVEGFFDGEIPHSNELGPIRLDETTRRLLPPDFRVAGPPGALLLLGEEGRAVPAPSCRSTDSDAPTAFAPSPRPRRPSAADN
jgi:hypothetical protein